MIELIEALCEQSPRLLVIRGGSAVTLSNISPLAFNYGQEPVKVVGTTEGGNTASQTAIARCSGGKNASARMPAIFQ